MDDRIKLGAAKPKWGKDPSGVRASASKRLDDEFRRRATRDLLLAGHQAAVAQGIVRQTRQRRGSMSAAGRLLLNRRLVQAPVDAIDYVITHELCHVAEPNHGPEFIDLLDSVMPNWKRRKHRLERVMA